MSEAGRNGRIGGKFIEGDYCLIKLRRRFSEIDSLGYDSLFFWLTFGTERRCIYGLSYRLLGKTSLYSDWKNATPGIHSVTS